MYWLKDEVRGGQLCIYMGGCIVINTLYSYIVFYAMQFLQTGVAPVPGAETLLTVTPTVLLITVLIEEVLFRLPLAFFVAIGWSARRVLAIAIMLSVTFGMLHGGFQHIFLQGASGLLYSVLFLKCGGLQKKYLKAITVTTVTHFLFDTFLIMLSTFP